MTAVDDGCQPGDFPNVRGRIALAITCDDMPATEWTPDNPAFHLMSRLSEILVDYVDLDGDRVGEVEPKTARRVMDLIASGNRYEIFALGLTGHTQRTIIREIFRDPSVATTVSFPDSPRWSRPCASTKASASPRSCGAASRTS